ncbi:putative membrane protein YeaQ/YmgE (transglycosylase-associated protein family) [Thermosporothrix hazakensis]|jgi:uncharacterized membrane protein YeaQ/YmgE (transglycosylase-associated protein family)|uniref:Transglycosylase n=2 Tax=Thermosporothrix TaxID=768650 RepID=A0A455SSV0_9CHLR|nr:GlsB/YeaQ/YmgE family stress response membrane protein [Thermosporothrix hazakensis]PZW36758.1 putative membrane protein YeaQ/YmgE (transglycosylase-associated protein family) [Thermosporothrix hazakensis]BBH89225.1 transglycosylase [Thermosporothrix sp. COM3]GCE47408.1 transglycosylase [Thermosporothrix hazakensis]
MQFQGIHIGVLLQPGDIIAWLLVGLISGYIASLLVRGRGLGCLGNTVVGLIGAVIGGYLASALNIGGTYHFCGTIFISFLGAALLLVILKLLTGGRS